MNYKKTIAYSILSIIVASGCMASEFSAKYTEKQGEITRNGVEYIKNENVRQVVTVKGKKQVIICRADKKVTWDLNMEDKTYIEYPLSKSDMSKQIAERAKRLATIKKTGTEKIQRLVCDKYTFTYKVEQFGVGTQWVSQKLVWPVKTEIKSKAGDTLVELTDIKIEAQPDKLFEIPKGFRKIEFTSSQPKMTK